MRPLPIDRFVAPPQLRSALPIALALLTLSWVVSVATASDAESPNPQALQASIGPWTLLDPDLREVMGTGFALDLSYAGQLTPGRGAWIEVSTGYYRVSGELTEPDPTFEVDDTVMEFVPVSLGLRNMAGSDPNSPVRVYFGAGATWALQRWIPPVGDAESSSTFGAYVELRPEVRVGDRLHLWVRQRLHMLSDNRFQNFEVNPSGLALSLGLRYDIAGPRTRDESRRIITQPDRSAGLAMRTGGVR